MKRDPEITFAEDDDDTLYVQFSGDLEVQFYNEETDAFIESLKAEGGDALEKGLTAQGIEMAIGLAQQMTPTILKGIMQQYDIDLDEAAAVRVNEQMVELLPGFIHHVMGMETEGEE